MKRSARSALVTAVTMLTVSATALAPVKPTPPPTPEPTIRLAAYVAPTQQSLQPLLSNIHGNSPAALVAPSAEAVTLPGLLIDWLERIIVPPSLGRPFPQPEFPPVVGGTSIDAVIKNVYNAVEPWVEWGFDVAAYAVGWVPYVGWLAPQIEIFYNFGERIVRSITFNIADWLGGNISFWDGLGNVAVDTVNAFIQLGIDQWNFWLFPLPPLPPIGPLAAVAPEAPGAELLASSSVDDLVGENVGEQIAARGEELTNGDELSNGNELTSGDELSNEQGAAEEQGVPGSISEGSGELVSGEGERAEEVVTNEEADPDLTVDGLTDETDLKNLDNSTTNSSGTVQAQGEIRSSAIATPGGVASSHTQGTDPSPGAGVKNEGPADPTQAPSTNDDDEAQSDTGDGNGTTASTE